MTDDRDNQPLNHNQRQLLGWYVLGYSECLKRLADDGVPVGVARQKLAEFAQKLQQGGGSNIAPRLKDYLACCTGPAASARHLLAPGPGEGRAV